MDQSPEFLAQVRLLAEAGRDLSARGWLPARTGHFSARLDDRHIAVTAPNREKSFLDRHDFLVVDLDGHVVAGSEEPAPETFLHIIMYRHDAQLGAVLHTHSVHATVLSRQFPGTLALRDYEVLRELPGVKNPARGLDLPVFANDPDVQQLAARVDAAMTREPNLAGFLIGGHGLYTWGASVELALHRVEAFEFMFQCETLAHQMSR
ncbi:MULTISPECIES: methylthioribulose 1-phosphate dehydratase [unclassified Thioalkalivibrio]|uniref:methylthioribulose 1-phosphate dehydratase n=1 Tax=unclassified Thioalkalivibrio TaxID=2621013 RepID=UPI000364D1E4|nr:MULTISPECIES: methylthioribulose 1-phosphate dehydratase [unclassified Thioalkalivibrio]